MNSVLYRGELPLYTWVHLATYVDVNLFPTIPAVVLSVALGTTQAVILLLLSPCPPPKNGTDANIRINEAQLIDACHYLAIRAAEAERESVPLGCHCVIELHSSNTA